MIVKGRCRAGGRALGDYLLSEGRYAVNRDENEQVKIWQAFGHQEGHSLQDILSDFELTAAGTRCEKPLYHVQIRTADGEALTSEQWLKTVQTLEDRLGLSGNERLIVSHVKDGHEHMHVVWNRYNYDTREISELRHDAHKRLAVAREMEREFDLRQLGSAKTGKLSQREQQSAERLNKSAETIKAELRAAYNHAETGQEFCDNLSQLGYVLAKGDRRDFLAVAREGDFYAIPRAIGEKTASVRDKMQDVPEEQLPTLSEAQKRLREKRERLEEWEKVRRRNEKLAIIDEPAPRPPWAPEPQKRRPFEDNRPRPMHPDDHRRLWEEREAAANAEHAGKVRSVADEVEHTIDRMRDMGSADKAAMRRASRAMTSGTGERARSLSRSHDEGE